MHDIDDYPQAKTIPGLVRAELSRRGVIVGLARVKQDLLKDLRG